MAQLFIDGEWYEQLARTALYESDYESLILQHAGPLFPEFYLVRFKQTVHADNGTAAQADFALVSRDYRDWWVGEVELAHHSLNGHVRPQVRTLAAGVYGSEHAAYLCAQMPSLDAAKTLDMMKGKPPRVLVVVNAPKPDWAEALSVYDALVAVFEVFRSPKNRYAYRLNGEQPSVSHDVLSTCTFEPAIPRFLHVHSPAALPIVDQQDVTIQFENGTTRWRRVDLNDRVWLAPLGPNPLPVNVEYELARSSFGRLTLHPKHANRRS